MVINHQHLMSGLQQQDQRMGTDKTGTSCQQNPHDLSRLLNSMPSFGSFASSCDGNRCMPVCAIILG